MEFKTVIDALDKYMAASTAMFDASRTTEDKDGHPIVAVEPGAAVEALSALITLWRTVETYKKERPHA